MVDETARIGWATPAQARTHWPDAPKVAATLAHLLTVAHELCAAYAPASLAVPDPEPVDYVPPARAVQAQILCARAVWTAARETADRLGLDDPAAALAVSSPSLSGAVKQLLRPPAGPQIG